MPAYDDSGFQKQLLLTPGVPGYSLGSFDDTQPYCKVLIKSVAIASDVATVIGQIVEGNVPAAGQVISIRGTQSNAGIFNVTNVALASVSMSTAVQGLATLTFALSNADVTAIADYGVGLIKVAEVPENIGKAAGGYAGQAFGMPVYNAIPSQGRTIIWMYQWTTAPTTSCTVALEGAEKLTDFDNSLQKTLDSGTSTSGETRVIQSPTTINFVRVNVSALSSTGNCYAIAKVIA